MTTTVTSNRGGEIRQRIELRAKGLVEKMPHSRRYRLLPKGYTICVVFLKLFERVYAPLTAGLLQPVAADARLADDKRHRLDRLYQLWTRGVNFAAKSGKLESLYRAEDPWGMATPREQSRFEATTAIVEQWVGTVGTLLELGCGEGHQSTSLLPRCRTLIGIDISERAIDRARARCPGATFRVADIYSIEGPSGNRFDLVTACEVLYYMSDVRAAIRRISVLGDHCLATYYHGQAAALDPIFSEVPIVRSEEFRHNDTRWRAVCWRGDELLSAWPPALDHATV